MRVGEIIRESLNSIWYGTWRDDGSGYGDCHLYKNPSRQQFLQLIRKAEDNEIRGCLLDDGSVIVWDAYFATHDDVQNQHPDIEHSQFCNLFFYEESGVVGYNRLPGYGYDEEASAEDLAPLQANKRLRIMMGGDFTLEVAY